MQGTTQMPLGCSGRAWHSARIVVAVGKGWQAGKLLAWRCRAHSGNVHVKSMLLGWSERKQALDWIQSPSMAALCHQASTGEEEQVSASRLQRQTTLVSG